MGWVCWSPRFHFFSRTYVRAAAAASAAAVCACMLLLVLLLFVCARCCYSFCVRAAAVCLHATAGLPLLRTGSSSSDFLQVVGDRVVSPPDHVHLFTERIIMHPLSFFAPAAYAPPHSSRASLFENFISSCGQADGIGGGACSEQVFNFRELACAHCMVSHLRPCCY